MKFKNRFKEIDKLIRGDYFEIFANCINKEEVEEELKNFDREIQSIAHELDKDAGEWGHISRQNLKNELRRYARKKAYEIFFNENQAIEM